MPAISGRVGQRVLTDNLAHPIILNARHRRRIRVIVDQFFGVDLAAGEKLADLGSQPGAEFQKIGPDIVVCRRFHLEQSAGGSTAELLAEDEAALLHRRSEKQFGGGLQVPVQAERFQRRGDDLVNKPLRIALVIRHRILLPVT
jgi:hypothetical protein